MENTKTKKSVSEWKSLVAEFQKPHRGRAWWQVINTVGSVILLWVAIYFTLPISWLLTCTLAVLAGLILVRAFIIFHDCGHGSFFKSRKANQKLGFITGLSYLYPLSSLEMGTFCPPCDYRRPFAPRNGRYLDINGEGILGEFPVEKIFIID